jgi:hypothetical protein
MAEQHRATADQWTRIERMICRTEFSAILELRDRVEALEAAAQPAQPNHPAKPDSSLVERVAAAITGDGDDPINWKPEARAAIREVAAWLNQESSGHLGSGEHWAIRLEQEAEQ